jgi:hypothetical protein
MVFMGDGRPEERHNAIAHDLIDGPPLIAMDRRDHPFQHRIEQLPRVLRIAIGQQFQRTSQVGKQYGDLLALAFQGAFGGEDFLG